MPSTLTTPEHTFDDFYHFALGVARRSRSRYRDRAADAAVDVLLALWPRRAEPDFEGTLVAAVRQQAKRDSGREALRLNHFAPMPEAFDAADEPQAASLTDRVDAAVARLPEQDREVAGMMFSYGMSARAAAQAQTGDFYADRRRIAAELPRLLRLVATIMEAQAA